MQLDNRLCNTFAPARSSFSVIESGSCFSSADVVVAPLSDRMSTTHASACPLLPHIMDCKPPSSRQIHINAKKLSKKSADREAGTRLSTPAPTIIRRAPTASFEGRGGGE